MRGDPGSFRTYVYTQRCRRNYFKIKSRFNGWRSLNFQTAKSGLGMPIPGLHTFGFAGSPF